MNEHKVDVELVVVVVLVVMGAIRMKVMVNRVAFEQMMMLKTNWLVVMVTMLIWVNRNRMNDEYRLEKIIVEQVIESGLIETMTINHHPIRKKRFRCFFYR